MPLRDMFTLHETALLHLLRDKLRTTGYEPYCGTMDDGYIWAPGDIPVMLIAHVDCISRPETIFHDSEADVFWSPDGLGADDRAGVWGILHLVEKGYRPSILFTNGEESGGWGARAASRGLVHAIGDVRVLVEIDRCGAMEAVYYDCGSNALRDWTEKVGFRERWGTFSDISILGPSWDIAAVNLSAGYYREHSPVEYLVVDDLMKTLVAVERLLQAPPLERWSHETERSYRVGWHSALSRNDNRDGLWDYWPGEKGEGRKKSQSEGKDSEVLDYEAWVEKNCPPEEWPYDTHDEYDPVAVCYICCRDIWERADINYLDNHWVCKRCHAELAPASTCCLCEEDIWEESGVKWFDNYPLCLKCHKEVVEEPIEEIAEETVAPVMSEYVVREVTREEDECLALALTTAASAVM